MTADDKPLAWLHGEIKTPPFSHAARLELGFLLRTMRKLKRKALEAKGWKVGDARDFLGLTHEEAAFIELKLALCRELKARRVSRRLSQAEFAARIRSSQSRVAKMESGDSSVSIDLLIRALLAVGASREELGKSISRAA